MTQQISIVQLLTGGDPRSLFGVEEVLALVERQPARFVELFDAMFVDDEIVRMRAGDAVEKLARVHPEWLAGYEERLLTDMAAIDQPSIQWHLAEILGEISLTSEQRRRAIELLFDQLSASQDWIVLISTMSALAILTNKNATQTKRLQRELKKYTNHSGKTISRRSKLLLDELGT